MFCPKCASQIVEGQSFCRNCGLQVGVIIDAMEGKGRGPLDFETLKRDLRDLGANLRAGFEGAGMPVKRTQRLGNLPGQPPATTPSMPVQMLPPNWTKEFKKALNKVKAANTRKYSLQQATVAILGGGAWMAVWYKILEEAAKSGLLQNLETVILQKTGDHIGVPIVGIVPVIQLFWLFGLIPVARGVAHLINGIFLAPGKIEADEEPNTPYWQADSSKYIAQTYATPVNPAPHVNTPSTNELEGEPAAKPKASVTEDETLRLEVR